MEAELYLKAIKLWGRIVSRKGYITVLHQRLEKTKDIFKREEIEKNISENVAKLDGLRKEFKEL